MRRALVAGAVVAVALAAPAVAWSHAALLRTDPAASVLVNTSPKQVALVFSESVEPRFAIVSVTDAGAQQLTSGPPRRSASNPNELDVPVHELPEGWYLVVWRVISVDGHPVRGAFTFAVGPERRAGAAVRHPQPVRDGGDTDARRGALGRAAHDARGDRTLRLPHDHRAAVGLAGRRDEPAGGVRRVLGRARGRARRGAGLRAARDRAVRPALVLVDRRARPVDARLRIRARVSRPGADPGAVRAWLRRQRCGSTGREQPQRSVASLLAFWGALLAAGAALVAPGSAGHAAQTAPRALALTLDALHVGAVAIWVGGLIGAARAVAEPRRPATRVAGLVVVVPRFSNVAFVCGAHAPRVRDLGVGAASADTRVAVGDVVRQDDHPQGRSSSLAAMLLASVNLLRTKPRLQAAVEQPDVGPARGGAAAAARLRRGAARRGRRGSPLHCSRACRRRRRRSPASRSRPPTPARAR